MSAKENMFHLIEKDDYKPILKGSYLLDDVATYNDKHARVRDITAFRMAVDVPGLELRKFNRPTSVDVHMVIGKDKISYAVFIVKNRYQQKMKFALPMDTFPMLLPIIQMTREIRIISKDADPTKKSERKKNLAIIPVRGEALEVYRYGIALFLDKAGVLKHPNSQALDNAENKETMGDIPEDKLTVYEQEE